MRIEQLKYLVDIKETSSLTQTADNFFISHQALSKSMHALENELEIELFISTSTGTKLNEAGELVCTFAEKVLYEKKILEDKLHFLREEIADLSKLKIQIYFTPRYSTNAFFLFLSKLNSSHYNLSIHNISGADVLKSTNFNENTLTFLTVKSDSYQSFQHVLKKYSLKSTELCKKELFVCVHKNSSLYKKEKLLHSDIIKYPSVTFNYPIQLANTTELELINREYILDDFNQQKFFMKNFESYALYTQDEYNNFPKNQYSLIPLADKKIYLSFICIHKETLSEKARKIIDSYIDFINN